MFKRWNFGLILSLAYVATALDTRQTCVQVINNSGEALNNVHVIHKYSSLYKNRARWERIELGAKTDSRDMTVRYNTGPLTTGRDWWAIIWNSADGKTFYVSDPQNFRQVVDWLERIMSTVMAAAPAPIGFVTGSAGGLMPAVAGTAAAAVIGSAISDLLFNKEDTAGFKQHILREDDECACTMITINSDRTITFTSVSGTSNTVTSAEKYFSGYLGLGESETKSGTRLKVDNNSRS